MNFLLAHLLNRFENVDVNYKVCFLFLVTDSKSNFEVMWQEPYIIQSDK